MQYLITAKAIKDGKPAKQEIWNAHDTLNLTIKAFAKFAAVDETSASLMGMALMEKVDNGQAQVLENTKNGHVLVIQKHTPDK